MRIHIAWMCFAWAQSRENRPYLSTVGDARRWDRRLDEQDVELETPSERDDMNASPLAVVTNRRVCVIDGTNLGADMGDAARALASGLALPLIQKDEWFDDNFTNKWDYALCIEPYTYGDLENYAVALQRSSFNDGMKTRRNKPTRKAPSVKPFYVDFFPPASSRFGKRTSGETGRDLLVQAVGPVKKEFINGAIVYDLTAGFGQDSLLLTLAGAKHVHMIERDPIVAALLNDAMRRLRLLSTECSDDTQRENARDLYHRLSLQVGDGIKVAKELVARKGSVDLPDIIYLDPMFPPRTKSALVKKNMQMLHHLLESQERHGTIDNQRLFQASYEAAKARLVVKRPINAPSLLGLSENEQSFHLEPSYSVRGKVNRWDVYIKR